ncbi:hypothetical protein HZC09_04365 [Candidatus Micrarchaeota archaeon]|nr:hypothetical protein [Candidatus Micrarchaeota archaeon]
MQLPEDIWKRRLESEHNEMTRSGIRFEANSEYTEYTLSLQGEGYAKEGETVKPRLQHAVLVEIRRTYPYPGGVNAYWLTPIFHPNIRREDGAVCIQLVNAWSETQNLVSLIGGLKQLLENPNPQSPLNEDAARYFLEHPNLAQHKPKGPRIVKL